MTGTPDILFFKRTSAVSSTEKSDRTVIGSLAIMSLILILVIRYSSSWISKVVASGADALFKSPSVTTPTRRYLFMTGSMLILFSLISLIASCIESFMSIVMGGALIQFFTSMVIFLFLIALSLLPMTTEPDSRIFTIKWFYYLLCLFLIDILRLIKIISMKRAITPLMI